MSFARAIPCCLLLAAAPLAAGEAMLYLTNPNEAPWHIWGSARFRVVSAMAPTPPGGEAHLVLPPTSTQRISVLWEDDGAAPRQIQVGSSMDGVSPSWSIALDKLSALPEMNFLSLMPDGPVGLRGDATSVHSPGAVPLPRPPRSPVPLRPWAPAPAPPLRSPSPLAPKESCLCLVNQMSTSCRIWGPATFRPVETTPATPPEGHALISLAPHSHCHVMARWEDAGVVPGPRRFFASRPNATCRLPATFGLDRFLAAPGMQRVKLTPESVDVEPVPSASRPSPGAGFLLPASAASASGPAGPAVVLDGKKAPAPSSAGAPHGRTGLAAAAQPATASSSKRARGPQAPKREGPAAAAPDQGTKRSRGPALNADLTLATVRDEHWVTILDGERPPAVTTMVRLADGTPDPATRQEGSWHENLPGMPFGARTLKLHPGTSYAIHVTSGSRLDARAGHGTRVLFVSGPGGRPWDAAWLVGQHEGSAAASGWAEPWTFNLHPGPDGMPEIRLTARNHFVFGAPAELEAGQAASGGSPAEAPAAPHPATLPGQSPG